MYPTGRTDVVSTGSSGLNQLWTLCPNLLFLNFWWWQRGGGGAGVLCQPNWSHIKSELSFHFISGGGWGLFGIEVWKVGTFPILNQKVNHCSKLLETKKYKYPGRSVGTSVHLFLEIRKLRSYNAIQISSEKVHTWRKSSRYFTLIYQSVF